MKFETTWSWYQIFSLGMILAPYFALSPKQLSCLMLCWTITGNIKWSRVTRLSIIFWSETVMFLVSILEPSGLWIYNKDSRFEHRLCSSAAYWKGPPLLLTSTRGVFVVWIVVVMIRLPHSHAHNSWFSLTTSFLGIWFLHDGIIVGRLRGRLMFVLHA